MLQTNTNGQLIQAYKTPRNEHTHITFPSVYAKIPYNLPDETKHTEKELYKTKNKKQQQAQNMALLEHFEKTKKDK